MPIRRLKILEKWPEWRTIRPMPSQTRSWTRSTISSFDLAMRRVPPPDEHVGLRQPLACQAMFRLVERRGRGDSIALVGRRAPRRSRRGCPRIERLTSLFVCSWRFSFQTRARIGIRSSFRHAARNINATAASAVPSAVKTWQASPGTPIAMCGSGPDRRVAEWRAPSRCARRACGRRGNGFLPVPRRRQRRR